MDGRPPMHRGHSDPTQRSSSPTERGEEESPYGIENGNDIYVSPSQMISSTEPGSDPGTPRRYSDNATPPRERQRVRFGPGGESSSRYQPVDLSQAKPKKSNFIHNRSISASGPASSPTNTPPRPASAGQPMSVPSQSAKSHASTANESLDITDLPTPAVLTPRRFPTGKRVMPINPLDEDDESVEQIVSDQHVGERAAQNARSRAEQLSKSLAPEVLPEVATSSTPASPQMSPPPSPDTSSESTALPHDMSSYIKAGDLSRRKFYYDDPDTDSDEEDANANEGGDDTYWRGSKLGRLGGQVRDATRRLLRLPTPPRTPPSPIPLSRVRAAEEGLASGYATPDRERDPDYVRRPDSYRKGVLSLMFDLYGREATLQKHETGGDFYRRRTEPRSGTSTPILSGSRTPTSSPPSSGQVTPVNKLSKWISRSPHHSVQSLIQSSSALSAPAASKSARPVAGPPRRHSGPVEGLKSLSKRKYHQELVRNQIQELRVRHQYMIKSCKALMRYGAPTHRLEEYMRKSARRLEIDAQFLYMPGCMIISFDSADIGATEVKIVRENQGVELGRLLEVHDVYKLVIHNQLSAGDANKRLDDLMQSKPRYNTLTRIFFYGIASATVGPFGFDARPIDMPLAFLLGTVVGYLQLIVSAKSESYYNVFEVTAAVVTTFAARGFGSIAGGTIFCFSALAQSAIALILPGFLVLCGALELQSRSMIAGSVRMVYAIIYSLFLGFGITIGIALYGLVDSNATQSTTCSDQTLPSYTKFIFVPIFTLSLCVVNQAKWKQMPVMVGISLIGYVVNFFAAQRFAKNVQVADAAGAFAVGIVGNLYSRMYQGMSAAAILPAIFVLVPSGISASGSLISGIASANDILYQNPNSSVTTVSNGTQAGSSSIDVNDTVFNVGYTMIQIAIGLTIGLFISALLVYPFGKKRSGLFSF